MVTKSKGSTRTDKQDLVDLVRNVLRVQQDKELSTINELKKLIKENKKWSIYIYEDDVHILKVPQKIKKMEHIFSRTMFPSGTNCWLSDVAVSLRVSAGVSKSTTENRIGSVGVSSTVNAAAMSEIVGS